MKQPYIKVNSIYVIKDTKKSQNVMFVTVNLVYK